MKKIILFHFLLFTFFFMNAQTDKRGTIVVKKYNCLDLEVCLKWELDDTLTISQINKVEGLSAKLKSKCNEDHHWSVLSYDISIDKSKPIHYVNNYVNNLFKKINKTGTITIRNIIVKYSTFAQSDKLIPIPDRTFFIIEDKK